MNKAHIESLDFNFGRCGGLRTDYLGVIMQRMGLAHESGEISVRIDFTEPSFLRVRSRDVLRMLDNVHKGLDDGGFKVLSVTRSHHRQFLLVLLPKSGVQMTKLLPQIAQCILSVFLCSNPSVVLRAMRRMEPKSYVLYLMEIDGKDEWVTHEQMVRLVNGIEKPDDWTAPLE